MSDKSNYLSISEIIWPYRPDILIRIDFLEWFNENKYKYFDNGLLKLTEKDVIENELFFSEAKKHPYFLQFTRKRRYRKLNLSKKESEKIYANGITTFINLLESVRKNGFDNQQKIGLFKTLFLKNPVYGRKIARNVYMGDGCHRLACLIWLEKNLLLPKEFFNVQSKLVYKPVNSFGIFSRLKIFDSNDEIKFHQLFKGTEKPDFDGIIRWTEGVRKRFRNQNIDELFNIMFIR